MGQEMSRRLERARSRSSSRELKLHALIEKALASEESTERRVLLLGVGQSGKATLFKQIKRLLAEKEICDERAKLETVRNLIGNMLGTTVLMLQKDVDFVASKQPSESVLQTLRYFGRMQVVDCETGVSDDQIDEVFHALSELWTKWPAMEELWDRHWTRAAAADEVVHYLRRTEEPRIASMFSTAVSGDVRVEDVLRSRVRTTGVVHVEYTHCAVYGFPLAVPTILSFWARVDAGLKVQVSWRDVASIVERYTNATALTVKHRESVTWRWTLVGSQTSERSKWKHQFAATNCVLWVSSLTGFATVLFENYSVNTLDEDLKIFVETASDEYLCTVPFVLVFTKMDVLRQLVARGRDVHFAFHKRAHALSPESVSRVPAFGSAESREKWNYEYRSDEDWLEFCVAKCTAHIASLFLDKAYSSVNIAKVCYVNTLDGDSLTSHLVNDHFHYIAGGTFPKRKRKRDS